MRDHDPEIDQLGEPPAFESVGPKRLRSTGSTAALRSVISSADNRSDQTRSASASGATAWRDQRAAESRILEAVEAAGRPSIVEERAEIGTFGGLAGLLRHLHRRWVMYVGVAIDEDLEWRSAADFTSAWNTAVRRHPALVEVLAFYADHPVVVAGRRRHRELLASAGVDRCLPEWSRIVGAGAKEAR